MTTALQDDRPPHRFAGESVRCDTVAAGWVGLRDNQLADAGPILTATPAQWHDLIAAVRGGRLTR